MTVSIHTETSVLARGGEQGVRARPHRGGRVSQVSTLPPSSLAFPRSRYGVPHHAPTPRPGGARRRQRFLCPDLDVQFAHCQPGRPTNRIMQRGGGATRDATMDWQVLCGSCRGADVTNRISSNNLLFSTCKVPELVIWIIEVLESRLGRDESANPVCHTLRPAGCLVGEVVGHGTGDCSELSHHPKGCTERHPGAAKS